MSGVHNVNASEANEVAASKPAPRARGRTPRQSDYWRLGAQLMSSNKSEARSRLHQAGLAAGTAHVTGVLAAAALCRDRRRMRDLNRILARLGHIPARRPSAQARQPVLLPSGTARERLHKLRREAVASAARRVLRYGASGGHSMRIAFATSSSEVHYEVTMAQNRDTYRGRFKGWWANEDHHVIRVPVDWRLRVERFGLSTLGGMLTLDAHELERAGDIRVFAGTWARQGRGYAVIVDRGYFAIAEGEHFHALTVENAVDGLVRKLRAAASPRPTRFDPYSASVDAFVKRYSIPGVVVLLQDAFDTGACEYGVQSWCDAVGIDFERGEATLSDVLKGFALRPQVEVRRAVLHSVRRHRREARKGKGPRRS